MKYQISYPISVPLITFFLTIILMSCNGCKSNKVGQITSNQVKGTTVLPTNSLATITTPKEISLTRNFVGKERTFNLDPNHNGGEAWTTVWEEFVDKNYYTNRIIQLSPTVILYRRYPKEVAKDFFFIDQAEQIEFLDTTFTTIKIVNIWKNRPYQDIKNARMTYHHYASEGMQVIPYHKQDQKIKPTEYSLFTNVRAEGNHVIVNYELRSLETIKSFGIKETFSKIVGVKHTIHIYDLEGNLKYELKDIPSVDGAVVSPNGEYMMYTFGGEGLATANNPFGTIERKGWALMRLSDQKIVYSEFTDDGKLAFARLWLDQGSLRIAYSTPSTEIDYDYWIFYDESTGNLYNFKITKNQRDFLNSTTKSRNEENRLKYYLSQFDLQQIKVESH